MTRRLLLLSTLGLLLSGCPRGNSVTVGPSTYLPPSPAGYSVDRVAIGASIAAVRSALGEPKRVMGAPGRQSCEFERGPFVAFREDGYVHEVQGAALMRGDDVLVRVGFTEEQVVAALGAGWVEEQYRPTQAGGGMITTGSEFVGKEYRYRDDVETFFLWIRGGTLQGVRAGLLWPRNHREPKRPG